ncbi:hypothetical protein ACI65C_008063 [Semiaphis heraclei]
MKRWINNNNNEKNNLHYFPASRSPPPLPVGPKLPPKYEYRSTRPSSGALRRVCAVWVHLSGTRHRSGKSSDSGGGIVRGRKSEREKKRRKNLKTQSRLDESPNTRLEQ